MSQPQPQSQPPPITLNDSNDLNIQRPGTGNGEDAVRNQPSSRALTPQSPTTAVPGSPNPMYHNQSPMESSELLLPPSRRFQQSAYVDSPGSSRRSSWSTEGYRNSQYGPFASPFDDSRTPSRAASPDPLEPVNMQTITEKYNITPSAGLLVYPNDKEDDDALHDPTAGDKERDCDIFTRRGAINLGGLAFLAIGLLVLFIGYPVLTFVKDATSKTDSSDCSGDLCLNVGKKSLLKNVRTGLIDPDTPDDAKTKTASNGKEYKLVFSDEFNTAGRSFYSNEDPFWQAQDLYYAATQDLEWYDPDAVTTKDGYLEIEFARHTNHDLKYRSGMLQSWNKLCFKGGIVEASISLPGPGDISGFWPGFWAMGNLGRPGYLATTDGMWPYSYHDECDAGITANQSSHDGISYLPGMKLPACTCSGEDHPNQGKSRSAPEIDAIEGSVSTIDAAGSIVGTASQSAQVAPFDIWYQPNYDFMAVYHPEFTVMNSYRGGPYQEAISGLTVLNNTWFDGKGYQGYGFEYEPGLDGFCEWRVGDEKTWRMEAAATGANGNIGARPIPQEPMAFVINCGMSTSFAPIADTLDSILPATLRVDWVRIWQDPDCDDCHITCDPPDYPTTQYISDHAEAYQNPNLTSWEDTSHSWPKNSLVHSC